MSGRERLEQLQLRLLRFGNHLPPHWRVAVNVGLRRDLFFLYRPERTAVAAMCRLTTIELPPAAIERALRMREFRHNVICFAPTEGFTTPFCDHPTYVFLREVVIEGKDYNDTTMYREATEGGKVKRRREGGERVRLTSDADFAIYRERCLALAESIARHGVIDIESPAGAAFRATPEDNNLLVAIDESGAFIHYRRGRHRLALAQLLGTGSIPASIYFVSGSYLLAHLPRRTFRFHTIAAAVARSAESALSRAAVRPG